MLLLNPRTVSFGGVEWEEVSAVVIDRSAGRAVKEWSDLGPHVVLADVPEQVVTVRVVQQVARGEVGSPTPSESGELVFHTAPAGGDAPRKKVSARCVVTDVTHELSLKNGAVRTVKLIALSSDGAADPVTLEDADGIG